MNTDDKFLESKEMPPLTQLLTLALSVLDKLQGTMDIQEWGTVLVPF